MGCHNPPAKGQVYCCKACSPYGHLLDIEAKANNSKTEAKESRKKVAKLYAPRDIRIQTKENNNGVTPDWIINWRNNKKNNK